jgi:hypothetical protein
VSPVKDSELSAGVAIMLRVPGPGVPALAAESDIVFVLARRAGAATTGLVDEGWMRASCGA